MVLLLKQLSSLLLKYCLVFQVQESCDVPDEKKMNMLHKFSLGMSIVLLATDSTLIDQQYKLNKVTLNRNI